MYFFLQILYFIFIIFSLIIVLSFNTLTLLLSGSCQIISVLLQIACNLNYIINIVLIDYLSYFCFSISYIDLICTFFICYNTLYFYDFLVSLIYELKLPTFGVSSISILMYLYHSSSLGLCSQYSFLFDLGMDSILFDFFFSQMHNSTQMLTTFSMNFFLKILMHSYFTIPTQILFQTYSQSALLLHSHFLLMISQIMPQFLFATAVICQIWASKVEVVQMLFVLLNFFHYHVTLKLLFTISLLFIFSIAYRFFKDSVQAFKKDANYFYWNLNCLLSNLFMFVPLLAFHQALVL